MQRRAFLLSAGAVMSAGASSSGIIDTHIHFYDPSRPQGVPWPAKTETRLYRTVLPRHFEEVTRGLGVTGLIVVEASPWIEDNQWILDLARTSPIILGLVGNLPCGTPEFATHLERFQKNPLFRGIRLNGRRVGQGMKEPEFLRDLKRLPDAGLALDAIGGDAMLPDIARLNDAIPGLRIVINHLPFDAPASAALRELRARPLVYAKVSDVGPITRREWLEELWEIFGPDRVIYGSNWPVIEREAPYAESLEIVRKFFTDKGATASARYFRDNSQVAYRWTGRDNSGNLYRDRGD